MHHNVDDMLLVVLDDMEVALWWLRLRLAPVLCISATMTATEGYRLATPHLPAVDVPHLPTQPDIERPSHTGFGQQSQRSHTPHASTHLKLLELPGCAQQRQARQLLCDGHDVLAHAADCLKQLLQRWLELNSVVALQDQCNPARAWTAQRVVSAANNSFSCVWRVCCMYMHPLATHYRRT